MVPELVILTVWHLGEDAGCSLVGLDDYMPACDLKSSVDDTVCQLLPEDFLFATAIASMRVLLEALRRSSISAALRAVHQHLSGQSFDA